MPATLQQQLQTLVTSMIKGHIEYKEALRAFERQYLIVLLEQHQGNACRAAQATGVHRNTLSRNLQQCGIRVMEIRRLYPHPSTGHKQQGGRRTRNLQCLPIGRS
jgi:DNA-binding NtrC family response regulator